MVNYGRLYIPIDRSLEFYYAIAYKKNLAYFMRDCKEKHLTNITINSEEN